MDDWSRKPCWSAKCIPCSFNGHSKNPGQAEFIYQVADEDGVEYQKFLVEGYQTVTIEENEIETIVIKCPELELTLNLSIEHNFQPVLIHKVNGDSEFKLVLKEFKTPT